MKYDIGKRIRQFREERGMSQKDLAERLKLTSSRVSNWEQGINRPDADRIASICTILQVSPSELLDVHIAENDLTTHERRIIASYRNHPELRQAVDKLLDV